MSEPLKVGDLVQLRHAAWAGWPPMLVDEVPSYEQPPAFIGCTWFNLNRERQSCFFPVALLERIEVTWTAQS